MENTHYSAKTKDMKDGIRIRKERQEYPGVRLDGAIHEKLRTYQMKNVMF